MNPNDLMQNWAEQILSYPELTGMGHRQRVEDANLGLGWVYYGLVRALRPATAVVIGSWRGFVPLVLARALADNSEGGEVIFIDPSLVDDFWSDPVRVSGWFAQFGADNITHHLHTTQSFVRSEHYRALREVGMLFVDGYHSREQARIDHESFVPKLTGDAVVLFHDTRRIRTSRIYGQDEPYEHQVKDYVEDLKRRGDLQVLDLPCADGVTLVRRQGDG